MRVSAKSHFLYHRVLGANNSLTGYSGGINNKIALLENENIKFAQKVLEILI